MLRALLTVTSPVSPLRVVPFNLHVKYAEYKHDVLTFAASAGSASVKTPFVSGLPVRVQWMAGPSTRGVFYGYIDKVERKYSPTGGSLLQRQFVVHCYGTTYPLKSEEYAVYTDKTADFVLQDIAKLFQFASVVDPHNVSWPSLAQSGASWWTFACDIAKRVGYTLYSRDATLFALDRRTALSTAQAFSYNLAARPQGVRDALRFEPCSSGGSGVSGDAPGQFVVRGQSMFSGDNFVQQAESRSYLGNVAVYTPLFQRVINETPRTLAEAQTYLNAAVSKSLFTQQATMTVVGNANLKVGSVINLNAPFDSVYEGSWYVLSAEHQIMPDRYNTVVELGKDAAGYAHPVPPPLTSAMKGTPGVVFRNNMWTAAWSTS